jgi:molecular chaperone GrpE
VDDFERAFKSLDISLAGMTWFDGIQLIYRKLLVLLENAGVRPIETESKEFDPNFHEAVAHIPGDEGKIVNEVQRGYMLHDRVLRPAMVAVGNGAGTDQKSPEEDVTA